MTGGERLMAQTLTVEEYRAKVLDYNQDIKQSKRGCQGGDIRVERGENGILSKVAIKRELFVSDRRRGIYAGGRSETQ